jgi:hypothetical protein
MKLANPFEKRNKKIDALLITITWNFLVYHTLLLPCVSRKSLIGVLP